MDEYVEVEHLDECVWKVRGIIKTLRWWTYMNLKSCPSCNERILA